MDNIFKINGCISGYNQSSNPTAIIKKQNYENHEIVGGNDSNIRTSRIFHGLNKIIDNNNGSHVVEPGKSVRQSKEKSLHPERKVIVS